jgi:hypothetical protein
VSWIITPSRLELFDYYGVLKIVPVHLEFGSSRFGNLSFNFKENWLVVGVVASTRDLIHLNMVAEGAMITCKYINLVQPCQAPSPIPP